MARLTVNVLGRFEACADPPGRPLHLTLKKARAILATLAWVPGAAKSREALIGLLWPEFSLAQARNSFRVTLSSLRATLLAARVHCLQAEGDTVALAPDDFDSDIAAFRRLVAHGAPEELSEAVSLYRGDLLEGFDVGEAAFEEFLSTEREQLRVVAQGACEKLLAHQLQAGADESALATAFRLLALDPLLEPVHRTVMRLHAQSRRFGAARRQYQACIATLQRDLGIGPAAETRHLYEEILRMGTTDIGDPGVSHPGQTVSWSLTAKVPQIGRAGEMVRLRDAYKQARAGHGQCIVVMGEAGIGKTRLVSELAGEARPAGTQVWLGRAYESDRMLTFGPWVDAIRTSGLVRDSARLAGFSPVWRAELARLVPELGEPSRADARHQDSARRLFEAVAQLVRHMIDRQPLVLILEDMHWADELSVRLLSFVARRVGEWPVLVVVTVRDEELDARCVLRLALDELTPTGSMVQLRMNPLAAEDTASLIQELVRTDRKKIEAKSVLAQVWAMSRGNPFMIVEAFHVLADSATASPEGALQVTPRIREVVARRLTHLTERGRRLIAVAAVIGRPFEFPVLQRASGLGELEAAEGVDDLVRRRLLHVFPREIDIAHDWVRQVTYEGLQPPLRTVLHAAVARAIEERYATNLESHYPALGRHYLEGEVWDRAVIYLHAAGRAAVARVGHREAVSRFESALAALPLLTERKDTLERGIDLRLDLQRSLSALGDFEQLVPHLREAETLARRLDDQARLGWVQVYMSFYTRMIRRSVDAFPLARSAYVIAEKLGDVDLKIQADFELGVAHQFAGDHRSAQELLLRAFQVGATRLERPRGRAVTALSALSHLAWSLAECGRFEEAAIHGREALRLAENLDSPINTVIARSQLSNVHEIRGEFDCAIPILEGGLAIARERELTLLTAGVMGSLSAAYAMAGRVTDGLAMLDELLETFGLGRIRSSQSHVVVKLGQACLAGGRIEQARVLAARALSLTREWALPGWEAYALCLLGEVETKGGSSEFEEAEGYYRAALARSQELGLRPLEAGCYQGLGLLYRQHHREREAREHQTMATTMRDEMSMRT